MQRRYVILSIRLSPNIEEKYHFAILQEFIFFARKTLTLCKHGQEFWVCHALKLGFWKKPTFFYFKGRYVILSIRLLPKIYIPCEEKYKFAILQEFKFFVREKFKPCANNARTMPRILSFSCIEIRFMKIPYTVKNSHCWHKLLIFI